MIRLDYIRSIELSILPNSTTLHSTAHSVYLGPNTLRENTEPSLIFNEESQL